MGEFDNIWSIGDGNIAWNLFYLLWTSKNAANSQKEKEEITPLFYFKKVDSMASDDKSVFWAVVLSTSVLFSLLSVRLPNRYAEIKRRRFHNGTKLFNETLATVQLNCVPYFLAFAFTADVNPDIVWLKHLGATIGVYLSLIFYSESAYLNATQDDEIQVLHQCPVNACNSKLSFRIWLQVCGFNLVCTSMLLLIGVLLVFLV